MRAATCGLLTGIFLPAQLSAHGPSPASCLAVGFALYVLPALLLLFVRWHRWWARLVAAAVLTLGTVLLWMGAFPGAGIAAEAGACGEWLLLLSPAILAFITAGVLRRISPPPPPMLG